jgi:hypothetical protein
MPFVPVGESRQAFLIVQSDVTGITFQDGFVEFQSFV